MYDVKFARWLNDHGYFFILLEGCGYCNQLLNSFTEEGADTLNKETVTKKPREFSKYSFPIFVKNGKPVEFKSSKRELTKLHKEYKKEQGQNSFGSESYPLKGWGSFSYDPRCTYNKFGKRKKKVSFSFGSGLHSNQSTLPEQMTNKWYDKRGNNGFQDLPKSIYRRDKGNVYSPNKNPYEKVHTGILPRPYGPRDNAAMEYAWREHVGGSGYGLDWSQNTDKSSWYPHQKRSWKSGGEVSYANKGLYLSNAYGSSGSLEKDEMYSHIDDYIEAIIAYPKFDGIDDFFNLWEKFGKGKKDNIFTYEELIGYAGQFRKYLDRARKSAEGAEMLKSEIYAIANRLSDEWSREVLTNMLSEDRNLSLAGLTAILDVAQHMERNTVENGFGVGEQDDGGDWAKSRDDYINTILRMELQAKRLAPEHYMGYTRRELDGMSTYTLREIYEELFEIIKNARKTEPIRRTNGVNYDYNGHNFGSKYPDYNLNRSFQPPMVMYGNPGANTYNRLTDKRYLPAYKPPRYGKLKVRPNNNPTGWLSDTSVVPVSGTRYGRRRRGFGSQTLLDEANPMNPSYPYPAQPMVVANQEASGMTMSGQPLDLWRYQNTDYGTYNYPEFLAPRYWMGGFGKKKGRSRRRTRSIGEGDIIEVSRGKINVRRGHK